MMSLSMLAQAYEKRKAQASRDRDYALKLLKLPLPSFGTPEQLNDWMNLNLMYTGDGPRVMWMPRLGRYIGVGFPDLYTHPEVMSAAAQINQSARIEVDCDDYAAFAYLALKQQQRKGSQIQNVQMYMLISGSIQMMWEFPFIYWPSHVICTFERWDENVQSFRTGVIDTNGLNWFNNIRAAVEWFGGAYRTSYISEPIGYPFVLT